MLFLLARPCRSAAPAADVSPLGTTSMATCFSSAATELMTRLSKPLLGATDDLQIERILVTKNIIRN